MGDVKRALTFCGAAVRRLFRAFFRSDENLLPWWLIVALAIAFAVAIHTLYPVVAR